MIFRSFPPWCHPTPLSRCVVRRGVVMSIFCLPHPRRDVLPSIHESSYLPLDRSNLHETKTGLKPSSSSNYICILGAIFRMHGSIIRAHFHDPITCPRFTRNYARNLPDPHVICNIAPSYPRFSPSCLYSKKQKS